MPVIDSVLQVQHQTLTSGPSEIARIHIPSRQIVCTNEVPLRHLLGGVLKIVDGDGDGDVVMGMGMVMGMW